jgi:hypothetical protein
MKRILLLGAMGAALLLPAFATSASAGPDETPGRGPRAERAGRAHRMECRGRRLHRRHHRHQRHLRLRRLMRELAPTDAQRELAKAARAETQGAREALGAEVRAILQEARAGERTPEARTAVRERVKAARERALSAVEPQARRMLGSLSAEQRKVLEDRAARRGKTLDEARLLRHFEALLLRPGRPGPARAR